MLQAMFTYVNVCNMSSRNVNRKELFRSAPGVVDLDLDGTENQEAVSRVAEWDRI